MEDILKCAALLIMLVSIIINIVIVDMELSFCNDGLKGYVDDIQDRREIIDEERGLCVLDKYTLEYLGKLEKLLNGTAKIVDELLR